MARRVVAVVPDLFFAAKIEATARAAAVTLEQVAPSRLVESCRTAAPDLVILDLATGESSIALARALKADAATRDIPLVGFYSHVDGATRRAALAAGVDQILPRSAFVAKLPGLLQGT
jgi:DNA-binding NarL/FixJ family response regulator